jgi:hypothetical protein
MKIFGFKSEIPKFVAMITLLFMLFAIPMAFMPARASAAGPMDQVIIYPSGDPCQNPNVTKSSSVISVSTGTTNLVPITAGKSVYICSVAATLAGTTPNFQLVTGMTSTCSTSQVALTGVMVPAANAMMKLDYGGTVAKGSSGGAICAIMSAATTTATGVINYVVK